MIYICRGFTERSISQERSLHVTLYTWSEKQVQESSTASGKIQRGPIFLKKKMLEYR